ncbi:MAG: ABC1 kinase family protein, partial [Bacillaceae bacterium]
MFFQFFILAIIVAFISGRFIGTKISFTKKVITAVSSVTITSAVYWFMYLRYQDFTKVAVDRYFWLGSMLLVFMLFYLMFEMFDPIKYEENENNVVGKRNPFSRLLARIRRHIRYIHVFFIAIKNGIGKNVTVKRTTESDRQLAISLRKTLEACGGVFIKFGQVLSTRSDLLPSAFIEELSHLQENVTGLTHEQVVEILTNELHAPMEDIFSSFEMKPLAAASIGQVHRAQLKEGNKAVVVKLLRPDISEKMTRDLDILIHFAAWISDKSTWAKSIGFLDLAKGFSIAMREEIDFKIEAQNFIQIANSMKDSKSKVKIPKVYQEISNSKILVLEYLDGVSIKSGLPLLKSLNIDTKVIQQQLFDCILEQIFFKGIFHADPHPGNVYILYDGTPALLDFGAVGRLGSLQQDALKRMLIGFERKNTYLLVDSLLQLVEPKAYINKVGLERAVSQLLIQTEYTSSNSTEELIQPLFKIVAEFELAFSPMVASACRTLITLEGTMLQLNPDFNLMNEARRFAREHTAGFIPIYGDPKSLKEAVSNEVLSMLPILQRLPRRLDDISAKVEQGELSVKIEFFSDKTNASFVSNFISQLLLAFIGTAFGIISLGILYLENNLKDGTGLFLTIVGYTGLYISVLLLIRVAIHAVRKF